MSELAMNWHTARLIDLAQIIRGLAFPSADKRFEAADEYIACLRTANVQKNVEWDDLWFIPRKHLRNERQIIQTGDILISTANSYELVGKVAQVKDIPVESTLGAFISMIRPDPLVSASYLYFFLASAGTQQKIRELASTTVNISNVSTGKLAEVEVQLAPRPEQDRIVAEIDKQFTRLDDAVTALKRVQANLKRYRASVLKAACEGRLVPTEAELARKEGRNYEPASELLKRILAERRAKCEADQLQKMIAAGKPPKNEDWRYRYDEPEQPNQSVLPILPDGWTWATIDQIAECLDGKRVPVNKEERSRRQGEIPYYGANGRVGWIDQYLFDEPLILVVEDETFVGRTIPFSYIITGRSWVNNHAHVLRPTAAVIPAYLNYSLMFYPFTPLTTGSTGRRKLTQKAIMAAPYALPPLQEQLRIVAEIEKLLSTVEDIAMSCDLGNKRSNVFRSAVLRNAFSGKLVPQDPNDEPASVLLERIRAERARASKDKTPKATNRAMHLDGQRRRRVKKLAPGVSPEKPSKNNSSAVGAAQKGEYA